MITTMDDSLIIILTLCLLVPISFLVLVNKRPSNKSPADDGVRPPGPTKLPIIGNLDQLAAGSSLPHRRLAELAKKHGPVMQLQLGEISTVVLSSAEWAQQVMRTHDLNFATRPSLPAADIILYGGRDIAFAPHGEYWRTMRKVCAMELLGPRRVELLQPMMKREMGELMASIASSTHGDIGDHQGVNLTRLLSSLGNAITSRAAFGESSSTQKQRQAFVPFIRQITEAMGGFSLVDVFPSSKFLRLVTGFEANLKKIHAAADAILEALINDHVAKRSSTKHDEEDVLDVLLNLKDNKDLGFPFGNAEIKAVILDIFLAGTETWTVTAGWVISELIKNPEIMAKAQEEVRRVFDGKGKAEVDEAGKHELQYLELVLKETLRLHAPGPLTVPRECKETVVINGYRIEAKTRVIVNAWAICRDPDYWVDPDTFKPERFLDSSIDYKGQDFQFIPFGAGRRICAGMHYGITIVNFVLANLLYHFDWKLPDGITPLNLDMSERFGTEVGRKNDLVLIAIPYHSIVPNPKPTSLA